MKDHDNIHLKIQDLCTCFSGTDPLKEMSSIKTETDLQEAALKWIALAVLHGVNANAEKISLKLGEDGEIRVLAEYRETDLPSPGNAVGQEIFKALRQVTHIEENKGKTSLALGLGDSSLDLTVGIKEKKGKQKIAIKFP